jgi:hypothetical protein
MDDLIVAEGLTKLIVVVCVAGAFWSFDRRDLAA